MKKKIKLFELPNNAYKLEWKDFKTVIRNLPPEQQEKYTSIYNRVTALRRGKLKDKENSPNFTSGSKLSDYQKQYVLTMASKFFTPSQIIKVIREEWKIKYSNPALNNFLKRHADDIQQARNRYISNIDNLRYVHERPRIEELTRILEEAVQDGNHKLQIEAIKELRHESKGEGNQTNVLVNQSITNTTINNVHQHLIENIDMTLFGEMALIKMINKHDIDFLKIAHRLKKQFIEQDPQSGEIINKEIPVKIEGVGVLKDVEVQKIMKNEEKKYLSDTNNVKDLLTKKLLEKKKQMNKMENDVNNREDKPDVFHKKNKLKKKKKKIRKEN